VLSQEETLYLFRVVIRTIQSDGLCFPLPSAPLLAPVHFVIGVGISDLICSGLIVALLL
jgi:hypothetical protein